MENPLKCPNCSDFRVLEIVGTRIEKDNKMVGFKIPFYVCKTCGNRYPLKQKEYYTEIADTVFTELKTGEFKAFTNKYLGLRFQHYDHLDFKYSSEDYYYIPGLYRSENDGFLTPVFFNKDVLIYYNNHPDYSVRLTSFSSGNIFYKDTPFFSHGFGINRNDKIFMWLGDLSEDFKEINREKHLMRFRASNEESDHDVYSKFYLSQIPTNLEDAFQESDNESLIFKLKNKFDLIINKNDKIIISKIDIHKLSCNYKPPLLNEKEQIFNSYTNLNIYLVENLQKKEMKGILKTIVEDNLDELQEIKTLQLFLKEIYRVSDIDKIISPLYVLNDLRQLNSHLSNKSFEEKYNYCKSRLSLPLDCSDYELYRKLISELIMFYEVIIEKVSS